jgi:hypothetical protein
VRKGYCVTVEAMRVSDGTVTTVGKPCVDDTLGQLRRVPEMYANCNNAPDDAQRSARSWHWWEGRVGLALLRRR